MYINKNHNLKQDYTNAINFYYCYIHLFEFASDSKLSLPLKISGLELVYSSKTK